MTFGAVVMETRPFKNTSLWSFALRSKISAWNVFIAFVLLCLLSRSDQLPYTADSSARVLEGKKKTAHGTILLPKQLLSRQQAGAPVLKPGLRAVLCLTPGGNQRKNPADRPQPEKEEPEHPNANLHSPGVSTNG